VVECWGDVDKTDSVFPCGFVGIVDTRAVQRDAEGYTTRFNSDSFVSGPIRAFNETYIKSEMSTAVTQQILYLRNSEFHDPAVIPHTCLPHQSRGSLFVTT
jgi:hypothetical protein